MRPTRLACSTWLAAVLVVVYCSAAVRGGERKTYDLRYRPVIGQRWAYEMSMDTTLNLESTANRANTTRKTTHAAHRQVVVECDEVLEVGPGGVCTAKRVTFGRGCFAFEQDNGRPRRDRSLGYPGKTLTMRLLDDETVDTDYGTKPGPEKMRELRELVMGRSYVFPGRAVAIGDRWTADDAVREQMHLGPGDTISTILTLKAVRDRNGRQVADIALTAGVIAKVLDANVEVALEGTYVVDVATGVIVKADAVGQSTVAASAHNGAFVLNGTGTYEYHRAARMLPPPAAETALTE
jgi:hypothetical protein